MEGEEAVVKFEWSGFVKTGLWGDNNDGEMGENAQKGSGDMPVW